MTPTLRWPLLPLAAVLALALLAVFLAPPERTAQANHIDPPPGLTATARTDTSITVSWNNPDDEALVTHYRIRWRESDKNFTSANREARPKTANPNSREVTGLNPDTSYLIQVHSCTDSGCGHISSSGPSVEVRTVPSTPTDLAVTTPWLGVEIQAQIRWQHPGLPNSGEFRVRFKRSQDTTWGNETKFPSHKRDGIVSGLTGGSDHDFEIRACHDVSTNHCSPRAFVSTLTAPDAPELSYTASGNLNNLMWDAPSDGGAAITDYEYRSREKDASSWGAWTSTMSTSTSFGVSRPDEFTAYEYQVRAVNAAGDGAGSNTVLIAGRPNMLGTMTAATASNAVAITLSWSAPGSDGGKDITTYLVHWRLDSDNDWSTDGALGTKFVSSSGGTGVVLTSADGLLAAKTYNFRYRADNEDRGSYFNVGDGSIEATTAMANTPSAPQNLMATPGERVSGLNDRGTRLTWTEPADNGGAEITSYYVRWRETGASSWPNANAATPTGLQYDVTGLNASKSYDYEVMAINSVTSVENANFASVTLAGRPSAPRDPLVSNITATTARLGWIASAMNGGQDIRRYYYQWRIVVPGQGAGDGWQGMSTPNGNTFSADLTGLTLNTNYEFRVRAENADRNSFFAATTATTLNHAASVTDTDPSPLTEAGLDGAILIVSLVGTNWITPISSGDFGLESAPAGLSIAETLLNPSNQARLRLAFDGDIASDTSFVVRLNADRNQANTILRTPAVQVTAETAPAQVLSADASGGAGQVTVTWGRSPDAHGYKVQWKSGTQNYNSSREIVITDGDTTTAVIRNLAPSTPYTVRVIPTKRLAPDGTPSPDATATTDAISAMLVNTNPSPLTERALDGGTVTVDLVGTTYVSSLDSSDFALLPQGVGGLSVASVNRVSDTRAVLTLGFTGNIASNISLQVVVAASANDAGARLTSDTATVIQAVRPSRVPGVSVTAGPASLTVTWRAASNADGYRVSYWRSADPGNVETRDVAGGSTTRTSLGGLLGDTEYSVRMVARSNYAPDGPPTNTVSATTLPGHAIVSATDPSPLTERNLDGATLTVDLLPQAYDPWAPRLDRASWTATGVPGVRIADVKRVSDKRLVVTLASDDTDFDTDRLLRVEFTGAHTSIETVTAVADVIAVVEPAPGRVQNVRVRPAPLRLLVTWDPVPDATGYRVEFQDPGANWWYTYLPEVRVPRRTIGALSPDTTYKVRVYAVKTRAPNGRYSAEMSGTTPAFGAMLTSTDPSPLHEGNLHGARLTVDLMGVEWERLVEGRYYRSQLGRVNDCSEAKYYDNCRPFIVDRSVVVTGIERVSLTRAVVSLRARNVDLQGNGLWIRFPDDLHTNYRGEDDFIVLQVIAPDVDDFVTLQNNRASVTVSESDLYVLEGGDATYTVVLDGQPTGNVVITASSDNGDVTTQPASLTFTRDNWQTAQTVTVRASHDDDAVDDTATISHAVNGAQGYAGIDVASVSISVSDDDEAGVTVHPTELSVDEGASGTYTVSLTAQPLGDVQIQVFATNGISVQPDTLTFTSGNWTARTVTVSAGQDDDTEDATAWITHSLLASAGSGYENAPLPAISTVTITDDDEAQAQAAQQEPEPEPETGSVTVSASSLGVREGDDGATYTVVLGVEPTENVTITVSSDNGDVTAEPASLTFTTGNWQSAQTVSVSAGEDADKDDELAIVSHGAGGGNYDGVTVGFVTVIVTDDDSTVEVLRDIYEAAGGANWTNSENWLSGRPLGEWHGVSVNEDGEVTGLALRDNNLVGTLAPELGKLEHLQVVSLDRNSLSGELPVELGDLSNLTRLALNRNSLTGAIPTELGSLSNLSIIGLARNQLSGALPASLGDLSGLTRLSLHDNTGLSGPLPSGFTGLTNLQRLAIANTGLCAPDDEAFTAWLDGVADKPGGVATCE